MVQKRGIDWKDRSVPKAYSKFATDYKGYQVEVHAFDSDGHWRWNIWQGQNFIAGAGRDKCHSRAEASKIAIAHIDGIK